MTSPSSNLPRFNLAMPLVMTAIAIIWNANSRMNWIGHLLGREGLIMIALVSALFLAIGLIYRDLRRDEFLSRAGFACLGLPIFAASMSMMTFLGAGLQFPLVDAQLAAVDRALGLDWPAYLEWSANQAFMRDYAYLVYAYWFPLVPFLLLAHAFAQKDAARLEHLMGFIILSGVCTVTIAVFLPASSVFAFHGVDSDLSRRLNTAVDASYAETFAAMRAGVAIRLADVMHGTVTFPSHHTVIGVMGILYAWRRKILRFFMVPPSLAMIAVTPVIGGHYFVDIVGGIAVACFAYAVVNRLAEPRLIPSQSLSPVSAGET